MNNRPLVSVIVPVYNNEKLLEKCVRSILDQTYNNLEILLVNDGSTDKSIYICNQLKDLDKRIIVIDKLNEGVSITRNRGIEEASGDYLTFVDSDDYIEKDMIEELYNGIQDYDLCTCNYYAVKNNKRVPKSDIEAYSIENGEINIYIEKMQKQMLFCNPVNKIYKADIVKKYDIRFPQNIDVGEDYLFNIEYIKYVRKAKYITKPLYNYVINKGTLSQSYRPRTLENEMQMVRNIKNIYEEREFDMSYIYNQYIELLKSNIYNLQIGNKSKKEIKTFIEQFIKEMNEDRILEKNHKQNLTKENKVIYSILQNNNVKIAYIYFKIRFIAKILLR